MRLLKKSKQRSLDFDSEDKLKRGSELMPW